MAAEPLAPRYEPKKVERRLYEKWMAETDRFHAPTDPKPGRFRKGKFSIVIPPPNVTGTLHLGHALDNTLQDILIRFKRMDGYNACWIPGTDHAGIATQVVVERELKKEGLTRHDLGRDKFLERVWKWKEQSGDRIVEQLKIMGCSCDWRRERFTMDEGLSRAVREHFVRLHEKGLIYRGERIVNWCPRCRTALSDLEVRHRDEKGHLWHIRYPLEGGGEVVVATTRPETMLGDTAVAVHPEDDRYAGIVGRKAILPLLDRPIPVIADAYVDRAFGSGAVKITPAHDPNDFEMGVRHGLKVVNILDPDATLNGNAGPYAGLDRYKARERVIADLEAKGLLLKVEDHVSPLSHCDRCNSTLEPLVSKQWFMKTRSLADEALQAVKDGAIRLVPDNAPAVFNEWMRNIRDWCISRQIWWGHRIPAWYCGACGETVVARQDPAKCPKCGGALDRDPDTLDTWFSSALWPFSTLGWPDETPDLKRFYPTDVLVTGWDIIFFWVARMMMAGLELMKDGGRRELKDRIPFQTVLLHSLITDPEGKKMSKSKGNVVDPLELFDEFGTDAARFTLASLETLRQSFRLSRDKLQHGRNFMNKIWNAARFALAELEGFTPTPTPPRNLTLADRWMLGATFGRRKNVVRQATEALDQYAFSAYAQAVEAWFWHGFCDIYIELAKQSLREPDRRAATQWTLWKVLDGLARLMHPVIPFITEEIWQRLPHLPGAEPLLMTESWPVQDPSLHDTDAVAMMDNMIVPLVENIRSLKHEQGLDDRAPVQASLKPMGNAEEDWTRRMLHEGGEYISTLCRAEVGILGAGEEPPKPSLSAVFPLGTIYLRIPAPADPEAERKRLGKERDDLETLLRKAKGQLANAEYVAKAPPALVEEARRKAADYEARIGRLAERLKQLG